MLCFVPVLHGCVWYVFCHVRKKVLLQCAITKRRDMGLYEVSFLGFGMGTMLANYFHMCGIMLVLRAVFNMLVRNASPRRHDLGVCCLVCQDLVSCCFYFILLPLGPEVW